MKQKLIKGQWYINTSWSMSIAGNFNYQIGNDLYFTEYVTADGRHIVNNFVNHTSSIYYEVPLSKILEFLPDGHIDKLPIIDNLDNLSYVEPLIKLLTDINNE